MVEVETLGFVALHIGAGTAAIPTGPTGSGGAGTGSQATSTTSPIPRSRPRPVGHRDHAARATCDGQIGWGMFEHMIIGRHDPSGFADWIDMAP